MYYYHLLDCWYYSFFLSPLLRLYFNCIKNTKPIRLIELFAGIGSQAKALKKLNITFESHFVCDFDKYTVASYNAVHGTNYEPCDITKITASDLNFNRTRPVSEMLLMMFRSAARDRNIQKG